MTNPFDSGPSPVPFSISVNSGVLHDVHDLTPEESWVKDLVHWDRVTSTSGSSTHWLIAIRLAPGYGEQIGGFVHYGTLSQEQLVEGDKRAEQMARIWRRRLLHLAKYLPRVQHPKPLDAVDGSPADRDLKSSLRPMGPDPVEPTIAPSPPPSGSQVKVQVHKPADARLSLVKLIGYGEAMFLGVLKATLQHGLDQGDLTISDPSTPAPKDTPR